jgi:hypothetical protein
VAGVIDAEDDDDESDEEDDEDIPGVEPWDRPGPAAAAGEDESATRRPWWRPGG